MVSALFARLLGDAEMAALMGDEAAISPLRPCGQIPTGWRRAWRVPASPRSR